MKLFKANADTHGATLNVNNINRDSSIVLTPEVSHMFHALDDTMQLSQIPPGVLTSSVDQNCLAELSIDLSSYLPAKEFWGSEVAPKITSQPFD